MPYRVQIQEDFDWRIGWVQTVGGQTYTNQIGQGSASSLADAQAQATAVRARHQQRQAAQKNALVFDQTFPD